MTTTINLKKQNFLTTLNTEDFKFYYQYARLADAIEVFRGHQLASLSDNIELVKLNGLDGLFFMLNGNLNIEYRVDVINDTQIKLNELTLSKYNEFERNYDKY